MSQLLRTLRDLESRHIFSVDCMEVLSYARKGLEAEARGAWYQEVQLAAREKQLSNTHDED